jgi:hypothetical protein
MMLLSFYGCAAHDEIKKAPLGDFSAERLFA